MFDFETTLTVHVTQFGYTLHANPTLKNRFYSNLVMNSGGISDEVPPGVYYMKCRREGLKFTQILSETED